MSIKSEKKMCSRCVLDEDIPGISFDEAGVCNYCRKYDERIRKEVFIGEDGKRRLGRILDEIRSKRKGKEYDCLIGLSGGVDSSYVAYLVKKEFGLRPLAFHLDNGWNSEVSERNIQQLVDHLGLDLQTFEPDWEEFKDLQRAYLKAGVIDIEVLTDHAIEALRMKVAKSHNIRYFLSGGNLATEGIMPGGWTYSKWDYKNIKAIHKRYGQLKKIKSYPHFNMLQKIESRLNLNCKSIYILNYVDYNREEAIEILKGELSWVPYGAKHYESVFTRFYQTYILPIKFGVEKRKAHLSNLICSGQMTREEVLEQLKKPLDNPQQILDDKEIVIKKLGLKEAEFDEIMKQPPKFHLEYPNGQRLNNLLKLLRKAVDR